MIWPEDRLTRFEVARLLGARSLQISLGAPVLVKTKETLTSLELSKLEFKNKVLPITVKRKLPNEQEMIIKIKRAIENWLEDHAGEV